MKDVGDITRLKPDSRVNSLMRFNKRLMEHPEVIKRNRRIENLVIDVGSFLFSSYFLTDYERAQQLGSEIQPPLGRMQGPPDPPAKHCSIGILSGSKWRLVQFNEK